MIKCPKCHLDIPDDSSFCHYCGSSISAESVDAGRTNSDKSKNHTLLVKVFIFTTIIFAGLFVFQMQENSKIKDENDALISSEQTMNDTITNLKKYKENYEEIVFAAELDSLGYADYNFHSNTGVIVLSKYGFPKKIALTAYWASGGTVDIDNSDEAVADIVFDKDSWTKSTSLTITPRSRGVSVVDFSNSVDNSTFSVIIIVK